MDEYVAKGVPLETASRQAVLDIGGAEHVRNQVREPCNANEGMEPLLFF